MELIQTAEYLEDVPSWEQRRFYPPRYGDPYYRGHGRGCGRGRGRGRSWLSEDLADRDISRGEEDFLLMEMEEMIKIEMVFCLQLEEI